MRLVGKDGQQIGIVPFREALRLAQEHNLDLVEVAANARPPVCRIMDYGRFKYEQQKREREARKKQRGGDLKEVKLRPKIEDHDFEVKARNAVRFLEDGDKVKVTIMFRGREIVHAHLAAQLLERLAQRAAHLCVIERPPRLEGRNMIMILAPRPQAQREAAKRAAEAAEARAAEAKAAAEGDAPDGARPAGGEAAAASGATTQTPARGARRGAGPAARGLTRREGP